MAAINLAEKNRGKKKDSRIYREEKVAYFFCLCEFLPFIFYCFAHLAVFSFIFVTVLPR